MPIYEYRCKDCGEHYERRQKLSDEPLKICEKCSGTLEKQWSRTGFQFKGEGWYVTDYAKKPAGGEKSSGTESTAKSDGASNKQSDKPASSKTGSGTKSD